MAGVRLSDDWDDAGWTAVPRNILRDGRLSFKAKGLVAWLSSHQAGFRLTREFIAQASTDGRESVETGVRELRTLGYLTVEQARDEAGRLAGGTDYVLHRQPVTPETRTTDAAVTPISRAPENPCSGKSAAKRDHLTTEKAVGKDTTAPAPFGASKSTAIDNTKTINQRATVLAQRHYDRVGDGNVPAWVKIIRKALERDCTDDQVDGALSYIADHHWTLTGEKLANALRGGPKPPSGSKPYANPDESEYDSTIW